MNNKLNDVLNKVDSLLQDGNTLLAEVSSEFTKVKVIQSELKAKIDQMNGEISELLLIAQDKFNAEIDGFSKKAGIEVDKYARLIEKNNNDLQDLKIALESEFQKIMTTMLAEVSSEFTKVKAIQSELKAKIDEMNGEISELLLIAQDKFNAEIDGFSKKAGTEVDKYARLIEKNNDDLQDLKIALESEFQKIMTTIAKKTEKVSEFSDGITAIEKKVQVYLEEIEKRWQQNEVIMNTLLNSIDANSVNDQLGRLIELSALQETRLQKLEKYSHTHNFGGIKV